MSSVRSEPLVSCLRSFSHFGTVPYSAVQAQGGGHDSDTAVAARILHTRSSSRLTFEADTGFSLAVSICFCKSMPGGGLA